MWFVWCLLLGFDVRCWLDGFGYDVLEMFSRRGWRYGRCFVDAFTSLRFFLFNNVVFSSVVISKVLFWARGGVGMEMEEIGSTAMGGSNC